MKNKIKKFIKTYNIASPDWSYTPPGFPHCETDGLSKDEKIILEVAQLAWINEHPVDYFGQKLANGTLTTLAFLFVSTIFISFLYYADVNYNLGLKFLSDFFA